MMIKVTLWVEFAGKVDLGFNRLCLQDTEEGNEER